MLFDALQGNDEEAAAESKERLIALRSEMLQLEL
jgi:hypothetical protein